MLRFLIGLNAAGLAIIVESWLNALVPNEQRGRVLTIYVLVYGFFFGVGQLLGQNLDVKGPEFLFIARHVDHPRTDPDGGDRRARAGPPATLKLDILKRCAPRPRVCSPACLNGLILTGFFTVGPLFGERIGFDQRHIVLLMACVSLGGLFLQWPIGYFSDKIDRLYALIGLGAGIVAVAAALVTVNRRTPFLILAILFAIFGGLAESLYAVGVAHANDRADKTEYVALSSTLLFVWALGAAIGPTTGTYAIQLIAPSAFFGLCVRAHPRFHAASPLEAVSPQARPGGRRRARNFSPIRKHRRRSTHGCRITARPLEKRWPAPRPAMPRRASRPPRNLNRPAPQPKE